MKHDVASWNPPHGIRLECACTVVLNALGYIGFKVRTFLVFSRFNLKCNRFLIHFLNISVFQQIILCSIQVISTSGDKAEYLWTLERNLDVDTHFQAKLEASYNN